MMMIVIVIVIVITLPPSASAQHTSTSTSTSTHNIQHAQTRTALLGFLHGKAFFGELSKLLGGVRPGSGVVLPQLVVDSILGLLTQVREREGGIAGRS